MNGGDQAVTFLYLVGCAVLVASALAVRRVPMAQGLKMAAAWVLIFGVGFILFTLQDDFRALGRRIVSGNSPVIQGDSIRIPQGEDGHYWVDGSINGTTVRFLVDSGATVTMLSAASAAATGIEMSNGYPVAVDTANGTIFVKRGTAKTLALGPIQRHSFTVFVVQNDGDTNVLGMNFLSSLSGWGVENGALVLRQ